MESQTTYTTCTYDANGERLIMYNQTHYYYYYYDGVNLLFVKKDNAIDMRYLYDNEGNVYCAIASDNLPYWHHTDIRGSVTNVLKGDSGTSSSPTLIRSYLYNAYGDTNYTTFSGGETFNANPYLAYTGAILDQETGLYYLMSRYYDPKAGSFISQDSYKGEGLSPSGTSMLTATSTRSIRRIRREEKALALISPLKKAYWLELMVEILLIYAAL